MLPSQIIGIEDNYTAFCFNEACAYILSELQDGKEIIRKEEKSSFTYKKPSDFYSKFD